MGAQPGSCVIKRNGLCENLLSGLEKQLKEDETPETVFPSENVSNVGLFLAESCLQPFCALKIFDNGASSSAIIETKTIEQSM